MDRATLASSIEGLDGVEIDSEGINVTVNVSGVSEIGYYCTSFVSVVRYLKSSPYVPTRACFACNLQDRHKPWSMTEFKEGVKKFERHSPLPSSRCDNLQKVMRDIITVNGAPSGH